MSDSQQGPDWWQASDGKWYPPQPIPAGGVPPSGYGYLPPGYGYPPPGYGYGYPPVNPQPVVPVKQTSGLAIVSLVLSILWVAGLGSLAAIVLALLAKRAIKKSDGDLQGNGLATAGLIVGMVGIVATVGLVFVGIHVGNALQKDFKTEVTPVGTSQQIGGSYPDVETITVNSVSYPVPSSNPSVSPDFGNQFAVASIQVCAGEDSEGESFSGLGASFELNAADGSQYQATTDVEFPNLNAFSSIQPNQCVTGFVTFEIPQAAMPWSITYAGLPNHQWDLPPSPPTSTEPITGATSSQRSTVKPVSKIGTGFRGQPGPGW